MTETIISKKNAERLLTINEDALPLTAKFWKIEIYDPANVKTYFYFTSNKHNSNTLMPVNFYKPILSIINYDENENL